MPFSTVFQLYHGCQCTYPCFPGVLLTSTPHAGAIVQLDYVRVSKSLKGVIIPLKICLKLPALVTHIAHLIVNIYSKFQLDILNVSRDITKC